MTRFITVSFALALLFVLPTIASIVLGWEVGFHLFGSLALFFGMCEIGGIAVAMLID